ncbi:PKD domain-containing protein [Chitinophaga cymbidii]|uniref:PKD domain-containing protein n=1 Tax=Chitinophaga cymbidii TaxID=1096750 RepID=A0A512RMY1_9BACT|nr:PKD domain-containing protein [Chitinophaga cymbidii]GEP97042.1 hypothetical protein CCY01nite_33020 [Chitinophaga cymbidii]
MRNICKLALLCGLLAGAASCKYEEIVEASYLDQKVYFPAAREGRFVINSVAEPGKPYRYEYVAGSGRLNVPLSVFRGAVRNTGNIDVNIQVDNDTINGLITDGTLQNTELLPAHQYDMPDFLQIANGQELAPFAVSINLDYLLANAGKPKALCLRISGSSVSTNPAMDKLILIIDPAILLPTAAFQHTAVDGDPKKIRFSGQATHALTYSWDFGDGGTSTERSPEHTYTAAGDYDVTLTVEGITGEAQRSTITQTITIL